MTDLQKAIAIDGLRSSDEEDRRFLRRLAVGGDITLVDANASPFDIEKIRSGAIHFNLWYVSLQDAAVIKRKHEEECQRAMEQQRQQRQRQEQEAEERDKRKKEKALARKQKRSDLKSAGLWTHPQYKTLKAARADGWHKRREDEVGGEEITLKGHTLVRNTTMLRYVYKTTLSKTYGMTPSMIEELGEPDKYVTNPHYQTGPSASLYLVERVETWIEDNQERIKRAQESRPVRSAAMKIVHEKKKAEAEQREKLRLQRVDKQVMEDQKWLRTLPITLIKPLPKTLKEDALNRKDHYGYSQSNPERAMRNHVRHRYTNYHRLLVEIGKKQYPSRLYPYLRELVDAVVEDALAKWEATEGNRVNS